VPVTVTCAPASGSQFAVGDTTVTCKAGVTTGTFVVGCGARRGVRVTPQCAGDQRRSCGRPERKGSLA
jgi:hypothetical protein